MADDSRRHGLDPIPLRLTASPQQIEDELHRSMWDVAIGQSLDEPGRRSYRGHPADDRPDVFDSVPDELGAAVVRPGLVAMLKAGITGLLDAGGPGVGGVARPRRSWGSGPRSARAWPICGTTSRGGWCARPTRTGYSTKLGPRSTVMINGHMDAAGALRRRASGA